MFDVGFSELVVIAIVALVVIGPERLPKVARTAGFLLGRLQRYVNDVKADINREMQLDELKRMQADIQDSARQLQNSISSGVGSLEQSVNEVKQEVEGAVAPLASTVDPAAAPTPEPMTEPTAEPPPATTPATTPEIAAAPAPFDNARLPSSHANG